MGIFAKLANNLSLLILITSLILFISIIILIVQFVLLLKKEKKNVTNPNNLFKSKNLLKNKENPYYAKSEYGRRKILLTKK